MKLASGTHSESNLLQRQKFCYKEIVTKTKVSVSSKFKFYTSFKTNNRSVCFNPIFFYSKKHLKKLQHSQRGQFQIKEKLKDFTYKLKDHKKTENNTTKEQSLTILSKGIRPSRINTTILLHRTTYQ